MGKYLRKLAKELLGDDVARRVWGRVEIIGDIAIIRKPPDVDINSLNILSKELLRRLPYVRSVWAALTPVEGPYRIRKYVHLAGEEKTTTLYKEGGCRFRIDIKSVYISPALSYEHARISSLVRGGEFVINMFAGAGLFSIIMAKKGKPFKVISIDINPKAYELMVENVRLNRVEDIVKPVLGDAGEVIKRFKGMADRVLMPLPELAVEYLPKAVDALRGSGVIHVYDFVTALSRSEAVSKGWLRHSQILRRLGVRHELAFGRVVRSVGPRYYQVVLDVNVSKPS